MPSFTLADIPENADQAEVDDVVIHKGYEAELSEEQAQRLRDAGAVFEGDQQQDQPAQAEEPRRRRAAHPEGQEA